MTTTTAQTREWRARNRDKYNAYMRTWKAAHPESRPTAEQTSIYDKRYRARHPERVKALRVQRRDSYQRWRLMKLYGITLERYDAMLVEQDNACGICRAPSTARKFVIDHDHATGRVRGLLCHGCNAMLGALENEKFRAAAAEYISRT